ncbi:MAG: hypothetical protein UT55_C0087G0008 [Candidatus Peregrinibacteria bacterium GW2011_GWE2_39_6]|nr:MAG: hypothetical protein UT36_C0001G0056 [Candidatus Peregrinibacteria bacterium GW2011_GWF2_39_17]KKR23611.1 MAG: hypothetical protein UT55_C0087G0008 [Candidatus Peregrinibacteria bacterium GW2011_GWE2_39_6]
MMFLPKLLVGQVRIELTTVGLKGRRSTTELLTRNTRQFNTDYFFPQRKKLIS